MLLYFSTKVQMKYSTSWNSSLTCFAGDTKAGTLIAMDRYGNKYFENLQDELPRRTPLQPVNEVENLFLNSADKMGRL
jgi:hypothetical protein